MDLINETPFAYAPFMGKVIYPKDTLTLIVKGTFRLKPDAPCEPLPDDEQRPPTGDQHYDDDPHSSCRYESDFVHFKPKADVCVVGHCHVPGGVARPACRVGLRTGPIVKSLMVFGKRQWKRSKIGTRSMSDPEPFKTMELRYENSFGGPGYSHNPVGKGIRAENAKHNGAGREAPNIKVLEGEQLKTMAAGVPAGFGPLGRTWPQRMALAGTYGKKWQNERWPWLPEDFNWSYFNAAPPDQQVKGYLKGNESLFIENMHPEHSRFNTSLPGVRVRCFFLEKNSDGERFREVNTHLDTLWVDTDAEILILVWRGLATADAPGCDHIKDLLIVQEPVDQAPEELEYYRQLFDNRKAEAAFTAVPAEEEDQEEIVGAGTAAAANAQGLKIKADLEAALQQSMAMAHEMLDKAGLDHQLVAALKAATDPEQFLDKLATGLDPNPGAVEKVNAHAQEQFKEMLEKHRPGVKKLLVEQGHDAAVIDEAEAFLFGKHASEAPPAPDAQALADAARSGSSMAGRDMSGADFSGMSLEGANFREAQLAGANFLHARLAGADFNGASLEGALFEGADLTGAALADADLNGARLSGATLRRADFSDAVLANANLIEADLSEALLCRAQLDAANLSLARLQGADLTQADLSSAGLTQADLSRAVLQYTVLDAANLTQAVLKEARGQFVNLAEAILTEADFSHAHLEDSNFSGCRCDFANFKAATLNRATLEGAVGRQVNLQNAALNQVRAGEGVSLPQSRFRRAVGARANWAGADLHGSDFILADMPGCDFSTANLEGCDCRTAELKQCVFDKASLINAQFNRANLFQVRMREADLTGANFKGCNLYGAEFLDAAIDSNTNFSEADLKGTKLAGLAP